MSVQDPVSHHEALIAASHEVHPLTLNAAQRILIYGQATLTSSIEAFYVEQLRVVVIKQEKIPLQDDHAELGLIQGQEILQRLAILQGTSSQKNYAYVSSMILMDRLATDVQEKILAGAIPIATILADCRLEMVRETLSCTEEYPGHLGPILDVGTDATLLSRTFQILVGKRPAILVTEKFPRSLFAEERRNKLKLVRRGHKPLKGKRNRKSKPAAHR